MRHAEAFVQSYKSLDALLVQHGLPPTPVWWIDTLEEFEHTHKPRAAIRKGRKVYASSCFAPRLGVCELLFGEHSWVPSTPPNKYAFLSVKNDEASERLIGVDAILELLGVPHNYHGRQVDVDERSQFWVYTVSLRTAVGGTVPWAWCDEVPHWRDDKAGANPAEQVIGKFAPAMLTQPNAHLWLNGSPYSTNDFHARLIDGGQTDHYYTRSGATWIINPTYSEEDTRRLEPDEATWMREYAAIPTDSIEDDWFGGAIQVAMRDYVEPDIGKGLRPVIAIDPKFDPYTKDRFGWAVVVSVNTGDKQRCTYLLASGAWQVRDGQRPSDLAAQVRELAQQWQPELDSEGRALVYSDQHHGASFAEICRGERINLVVTPWTGSGADSKLSRLSSCKTAMLDGTFKMAPDEDLSLEFRQFRCVRARSGNERIEAAVPEELRGKVGHADRATAVLLAASIALDGSAGTLQHPTVKLDPGEIMKQRYLSESQKKQREAWRRDPQGELLRALKGNGR